MFLRIYPKKHEARSAVIGFAAWLVQECFRGFIRKKHEARSAVIGFDYSSR